MVHLIGAGKQDSRGNEIVLFRLGLTNLVRRKEIDFVKLMRNIEFSFFEEVKTLPGDKHDAEAVVDERITRKITKGQSLDLNGGYAKNQRRIEVGGPTTTKSFEAEAVPKDLLPPPTYDAMRWKPP
ncbi:MAG: hypothetical protein M1827_006998 [Pycnora praestabilis]|nr:MAG: hypothetical protein M1827_006998 [Pycnora praestabilis]